MKFFVIVMVIALVCITMATLFVSQEAAKQLEEVNLELSTQLKTTNTKLAVLQTQLKGLQIEIDTIEVEPVGVTGMYTMLESLGSVPFYKNWDYAMRGAIEQYEEGDPLHWGNLGDCVLPVLIEGSRKGVQTSEERYSLVMRYLSLSYQLTGEEDQPSWEALEEARKLLF